MAIPTFASSNPAPAPTPTLPPLTFSANPGQNRMQKLRARYGKMEPEKGLNIFPTLKKLKNHRHRLQDVFTPLSEGATLNGLELGVFGVLLDFFT